MGTGSCIGNPHCISRPLLLFILCRRTRSKRQPVSTGGSDAPEVAVVISFPPGPPSNPPPPPPSYPPPNLPCLAPLTQPQPAWLEEIQRNLRFHKQEEEVAKQTGEKMDWSSSEGSASHSDSGRESPQTGAFVEQDNQHGNQFASGRAH